MPGSRRMSVYQSTSVSDRGGIGAAKPQSDFS
jgi:hypothetical protein